MTMHFVQVFMLPALQFFKVFFANFLKCNENIIRHAVVSYGVFHVFKYSHFKRLSKYLSRFIKKVKIQQVESGFTIKIYLVIPL